MTDTRPSTRSISTLPSGRDLAMPRDVDDARAAIADVLERQAFAELLGYRLIDAADLVVTLALPLRPALLQPFVVHGGAIYSLADTASTFAVLTRLWPESWATTVEQSVQFLRPVQATEGELLAFAHVRRFGRTISFVEATVTHDGREIATSRSTQMRQARPR
ncbi:MAG: PaaI family thioesterase [Polyangiales bacterium]